MSILVSTLIVLIAVTSLVALMIAAITTEGDTSVGVGILIIVWLCVASSIIISISTIMLT